MPALVMFTSFFAVGIVVAAQLPVKWWLAIGFAGLIAGILAAVYRRQRWITILVLLLAVVTGALRQSLAMADLEQLMPFQGQDVTIKGIIAREGQASSAGITYVVSVEEIVADHYKSAGGTVLLRDLNASENRYNYGDLIQFRGKMVQPAGAANFGQYDYRAYLERRGIRFQVALSSPDDCQLLTQNMGNRLIASLLSVRKQFLSAVDILPSEDAALLKAIALGERVGLEPRIADFFTASGTVHLMAVSGVHVGMVAASVLGLGSLLKFPLWLQSATAAAVVGVYVIWTGLSASAMRAGIMFLFGLIGLLSGRQRNSMVALFAAALILMLINPMYLLDPGFQLSFAATFGILWSVPWLQSFPRRYKKVLLPFLTTLAAQLATWPLTAYYFSGMSLIGFVASVVAIPLAGFALAVGLLGLLAGALYLPAGKVILGAAALALLGLTYVARLCAALPGAYIYLKQPPLVFIIVYYSLLCLIPWAVQKKLTDSKWKKVLAVVLTLGLLIVSWQGPGNGGLTIDFLAVGQGDAILITLPSGQALLVDTGPRQNIQGNVIDAGERIVLPYLRHRGIHRLEMICFTHGDMDHVGGGPAILSVLPVGAIAVPPTFSGIGAEMVRSEATDRGIPIYPVTAGSSLNLGPDIKALVLSPPPDPIVSDSPENDNSLVLYLSYGQTGFLLTGDAGWPAEQYMLQQGIPAPIQVLKVAHHGANAATSRELLHQVNPSLAVISVGNNNFGHPGTETLGRLTEAGAEILRTDQAGQIRIETDGQRLKVSTFSSQRGSKNEVAADLD